MSLMIFLVPAGLFWLNFKLEIWTRMWMCKFPGEYNYHVVFLEKMSFFPLKTLSPGGKLWWLIVPVFLFLKRLEGF